MKIICFLSAVFAMTFGLLLASEYDIVGQGASEAEALADAEAKIQAVFAKKAQQAANQVKCLCAILREYDPITEFDKYKEAWEAAKQGKYYASAQGVSIHQLLAKDMENRSFNVTLKVGGTARPPKTWQILTEVQIGKQNSTIPWVSKGQIYAIGQAPPRVNNVLIADVMIFEGAEEISVGSKVSSYADRWRMGIDYKTVSQTSKITPKVDTGLAGLLEDQLGAPAAKYKAVKVLRPTGMGTPSIAVINKTLKLQFPDLEPKTRLKTAKNLAWRYGRFLLIAAGITAHAISTAADLPENSDRFLMEMETFVAKCNSPAAPRYSDVEGVGEAIEKLYGLEPNQ